MSARQLLLDQRSLGLAAMLIRQILQAVVEIDRDEGLTVLLVEQNAYQALRIASPA